MGNRGQEFDLGDRGDRIDLSDDRTGLIESGFSFFDECLHGVERLAEVDNAVIDHGAYPRVTVQVGDQFHRIVRFLLLPLPCGSL